MTVKIKKYKRDSLDYQHDQVYPWTREGDVQTHKPWRTGNQSDSTTADSDVPSDPDFYQGTYPYRERGVGRGRRQQPKNGSRTRAATRGRGGARGDPDPSHRPMTRQQTTKTA